MTDTSIYGYDDNGSLTSKDSDNGTVTYTYDLANKLNSVTAGTATTSYLYNDSGIRVRSSRQGGSTTHYLVDANNHTGYAQVLEEFNTLGSAPMRSYVIGDDVLGQCNSSITDPRWLLYDGHGSTRQLINADGVVTSLVVSNMIPPSVCTTYGRASMIQRTDASTSSIPLRGTTSIRRACTSTRTRTAIQ